jgi:hypothetical protein
MDETVGLGGALGEKTGLGVWSWCIRVVRRACFPHIASSTKERVGRACFRLFFSFKLLDSIKENRDNG